MRTYRASLVLVVAWCIGGGAPAAAQSDESLARLSVRYWDARMERYPTRATALGDYRFNDRLDEVGSAARKQWRATLEPLLREVRRLSHRSLSAEGRLTRDLLERGLRDDLMRMECLQYLTPLDPLDGLHIRLPLILVSQPFRSAADYRAYAARLRAFPQQVANAIADMRGGIALGIVSPRVLIEKALPQIRLHIVSDATRSEFYAPLRTADGLGEKDRQAVTDEIVDAILSDVVPGYLSLVAFVEDEYRPRCRSTVGLSAVPNGRKLYAALAYLHTTVRIEPEHVHQLGLSEVARLRDALTKVQKKMGFEGSLDAFLEHMRTDPKQRFTSPDELVSAADAILQRTKPLMPRLFGRLPETDCVMKEIEAFRAASSPAAYYNPAPSDGSRPAYYYINTFAADQRVRFTLEALTYHEAIPGHHLQVALHAEDTRLPKFRRHAFYNAFGEGWALYAEKLGYDIGAYQDPDQRFGQLIFEMWRACRLVVDTGIHVKGWTRQQAIDYLTGNTALALVDIEVEIDRYIAWPAQALSYKIGELRISALRREAEEQLGDRFDLRAFHDAVLAEGSTPIDMLERRMRAWIAAQ